MITSSIEHHFVNIDDDEAFVVYQVDESVEEGKEGREVVVLSSKVFENMMYKLGYREVK